jgi:hypothetical protein
LPDLVGDSMTAEIIPFPAARRLKLIANAVEYMTYLTPAGAEKHLGQQLETRLQKLLRRGVNKSRIESDLRNLETTIRTAFYQQQARTPTGAA